MTGAQASRLQLPPTMQEKQCKRDACAPVNSNRGRIALSPSQPGLNPRSSHDNRTYNCFFNLGEAYEAMNRHDDSVEAFRQAIRLKPDFGKAYFNLGKTLLAQGNRDAAIEQYVILQNLDQDWAEKLYNLIYP